MVCRFAHPVVAGTLASLFVLCGCQSQMAYMDGNSSSYADSKSGGKYQISLSIFDNVNTGHSKKSGKQKELSLHVTPPSGVDMEISTSNDFGGLDVDKWDGDYQPMNITVRKELNDSDGGVACLNNILSLCTLCIWPLYDFKEYSYTIGVSTSAGNSESKIIIGERSWLSLTPICLIPVPGLADVRNTGSGGEKMFADFEQEKLNTCVISMMKQDAYKSALAQHQQKLKDAEAAKIASEKKKDAERRAAKEKAERDAALIREKRTQAIALRDAKIATVKALIQSGLFEEALKKCTVNIEDPKVSLEDVQVWEDALDQVKVAKKNAEKLQTVQRMRIEKEKFYNSFAVSKRSIETHIRDGKYAAARKELSVIVIPELLLTDDDVKLTVDKFKKWCNAELIKGEAVKLRAAAEEQDIDAKIDNALKWMTTIPAKGNLRDMGAEYLRCLRKIRAKQPITQEEKNSALIGAIYLADAEFVQWFIDQGAAVNGFSSKDEDKRPAIIISAGVGNDKVFGCLVNAGADVTIRSRSGATSLMYAAANNRGVIVDALLKKGASVSDGDNNGETVLMCAVRSGSDDLVLKVIAAGAELDSVAHIHTKQGEIKYNALTLAAVGGKTSIAVKMIELGADPVSLHTEDGQNAALCAAIDRENASFVKQYIDIAKKKGRPVKVDDDVLLYAVCNNTSSSVLDVLIKYTDGIGSCVLHKAITKNNYEMVKSLITSGCDVNGTVDGVKPLQKAIDNGNLKIVKLMVEQGASVLDLRIQQRSSRNSAIRDYLIANGASFEE